MRQTYEMTEEDLARLQRAMEPRPAIMLQCGSGPSLQQRANDAWAELGKKMNFEPMSVMPVTGKDARYFTAEPVAS